MNIGIIGAGYMGGMHLACYQALEELGVRVTAIADANPDSAKQLADRVNAEVFSSGFALIDNANVDAVDICLPLHMHTSNMVYAMEKGLSVFCEKPVALQDDELELLLETKGRTNAKIMIGHVVRFTPEYAYLKESVQTNRFGKLVSGVFQRLSAHPGWTSGNWIHNPSLSGGVAIDMHIHDVDFVRYLIGEPEQIQSAAYRDKSGLIQQIISLYCYGTDIAVSLEAAWDYPAAFPFDANYRVKFEEATVLYKNNCLTVYPNSGGSFHPALAKFDGKNSSSQGNISDLGGYYNELRYFVEGLQGKNDLSAATLEDAVAAIRLAKREIEACGGLIVQ